MRRTFVTIATLAVMLILAAVPALAGNPHFVGTPSVTRDGNNLIVSGKEAGLGNEAQVHILVTADASCINPGSNKPKAANKESFSAEGDFPVQNGKAVFTLTLTATFQPSCSPPMSVVWSDVIVTDTTNGISVTLPGPF
jgi:hypothetical protein